MMRKREREYTPEEAMAITLRDVTPHWYRSPPLVIGIDLGERSYPQPLDERMLTGTWVFFFVSATSPSLERMVQAQKIWEKRYASLGIEFVFAFRGHYPYLRDRKITEKWLTGLPIQSPAVCDVTGVLAKAFGSDVEPGLAILSGGKVVYSSSKCGFLTEGEIFVQSILRENAPGTSFWPALIEDKRCIRSIDRWILSSGSKPILTQQVKLVGNWELSEDRIVTSDAQAEIQFHSPGSSVELVAQSLSESGDPTRIRVDTNGSSFSENFTGKDMVLDDEGGTSVIIGGARGYALLRNLTESLRTLRFRFPFSKTIPVAVYGLEFGEIVQTKTS